MITIGPSTAVTARREGAGPRTPARPRSHTGTLAAHLVDGPRRASAGVRTAGGAATATGPDLPRRARCRRPPPVRGYGRSRERARAPPRAHGQDRQRRARGGRAGARGAL